MTDVAPNDYNNMTIEVTEHSTNGDLIARTVETRRHIDIAHTGRGGYSDGTNPTFLRLRARALEALANRIEETQ
ncbi:hypothetical protein [Rhodococcus erythropolis]|uniref:hypothetical protein n=1 Tax=Rhodococcus erythropolis TaxID=1833 RepID=UPI001BE5C873|nr:hypothetical protein [Rhodococcus erythropolis]MBT2266430.1 hypothetical protein [Rhodococcus erythropolis]